MRNGCSDTLQGPIRTVIMLLALDILSGCKAEKGGADMAYLMLVAGIFFGDLRIKDYVERKFPEEGEYNGDNGRPGRRMRLRGLLRLRKHHNRGAFLNLGQGQRFIVAALSVFLTAVVAALFVLSLGAKGNALLKTGLAMLLGGAFSNTYDRLKRKYVVDYFSFTVGGKWLTRIVFNISDFGIIFGAFLAALCVGGGE